MKITSGDDGSTESSLGVMSFSYAIIIICRSSIARCSPGFYFYRTPQLILSGGGGEKYILHTQSDDGDLNQH